jgi:hypothetical protein
MKIPEFAQGGGVCIYHASEPSELVTHLAKIARCMGLESKLIDLRLSPAPVEKLRSETLSETTISIWDVRSLSDLIELKDWSSLAAGIHASHARILLLTTHEDDSHILRILTEGEMTRLHSAGRPTFVTFSKDPPDFARELAGQRYSRSNREVLVMEFPENSAVERVMEFEKGATSFISLRKGASHLFLWSTLFVFDVDCPLERELEFEQALDEYIPAIIFLRWAFGEQCWRSPQIGADLIIDDPLLTKTYGGINFPKLLQLTQEVGAHITVAFIPWNHWRTRPRVLPSFRQYGPSFSICAHGCDHTKNEFHASDYDELLRRSFLAADRMDRHHERTGMAWDRLMVCPREDYTLPALQALADCGEYLGVVNMGCVPRNLTAKMLRGSDLLLPVQDAFCGVPIFKRYNFSDVPGFAMASFLGKPAILTEHHDFFWDRNRDLKSHFSSLQAVNPTVRWSGLAELARQTYQLRRIAPDTFEIRFFTDLVEIENPDSEPRTIRLHRRIPASSTIDSVMLNHAGIPFQRNGDFLSFHVTLPANSAAFLQIRRRAVPNQARSSKGMFYEIGVALRRWLSEVRDNWLSRNTSALGLANRCLEVLHVRRRRR